MLRDRAVTPFNKEFILFLSFGWSGRAKIGNVLKKFLLGISWFSYPLVLSVHTIVSLTLLLL
jgi:hypothetical protein